MKNDRRTFYTDGSVHRNGRADASGGYAWLEVDESGIVQEFATNIDDTGIPPTNIRMEMMAVISALKECRPEDKVIIRSDSAYVVDGMREKWYRKWFLTGVNARGKVPANMDLWLLLIRAYERISEVKFFHVKGHNGDVYNERCDDLAAMFSGPEHEKTKTFKFCRERC